MQLHKTLSYVCVWGGGATAQNMTNRRCHRHHRRRRRHTVHMGWYPPPLVSSLYTACHLKHLARACHSSNSSPPPPPPPRSSRGRLCNAAATILAWGDTPCAETSYMSSYASRSPSCAAPRASTAACAPRPPAGRRRRSMRPVWVRRMWWGSVCAGACRVGGSGQRVGLGSCTGQ